MTLNKWHIIAGIVVTVFVPFFLWIHPHLPASTVAIAAEQGYMAGDIKESDAREQGELQNKLELLNLKIQFLLDKQERDGNLSATDKAELSLAEKQRDAILARLDKIVG